MPANVSPDVSKMRLAVDADPTDPLARHALADAYEEVSALDLAEEQRRIAGLFDAELTLSEKGKKILVVECFDLNSHSDHYQVKLRLADEVFVWQRQEGRYVTFWDQYDV